MVCPNCGSSDPIWICPTCGSTSPNGVGTSVGDPGFTHNLHDEVRRIKYVPEAQLADCRARVERLSEGLRNIEAYAVERPDNKGLTNWAIQQARAALAADPVEGEREDG